MNLIMIAWSNIKKSKSDFLVLSLLTTIAIICLTLGYGILSNLRPFYEEKNKELNGADYSVAFVSGNNDEALNSFVKNRECTIKTEMVDVLKFNKVSIQSNECNRDVSLSVCNLDDDFEISKPQIIDKQDVKDGEGIVVPYSLKSTYGCKSGDDFKIENNDFKKTYKIAGFFEDVLYGNFDVVQITKVFVDKDGYNYLLDNCSSVEKDKMINTQTKSFKDSADLSSEFWREYIRVTNGDVKFLDIDVESMSSGDSMIISIVMSVLIGFSVILTFISLLIIKFSISNYINKNIKNIGVMEALGYRSKEIIGSILIQFISISIICSIIAFIISKSIKYAIGDMISNAIGLRWIDFNINSKAIICSVAVIVLVSIIAYLSAKKIEKVSPVTALRNGLLNHNFKKNYVSLEGNRISLDIAIALKSLAQNMKQNTMMVITITLLTFSLIFIGGIYENFIKDINSIAKMLGYEKHNIEVDLKNQNSELVYNQLKDLEGVEKVVNQKNNVFCYEKQNYILRVSDDYSKYENVVPCEGINPRFDNEIVVSKIFSQDTGKKLGDTITISMNGKNKDFIIVGMIQTVYNLGRVCEITEDGAKELYDSSINYDHLGVYLKDGYDNTEMIEKIEDSIGTKNITINNNERNIEDSLKSYQSAIFALFMVFVLISLIVIILILTFIVNARITNESKNMGISKALGFTSRELIKQLVISCIPMMLIGSVIGGILGKSLVNKILGMMLSSMGIFNCNLNIDLTFIVIVAVLLCVLSILIEFVLARKINKINPSKLLQGR